MAARLRGSAASARCARSTAASSRGPPPQQSGHRREHALGQPWQLVDDDVPAVAGLGHRPHLPRELLPGDPDAGQRQDGQGDMRVERRIGQCGRAMGCERTPVVPTITERGAPTRSAMARASAIAPRPSGPRRPAPTSAHTTGKRCNDVIPVLGQDRPQVAPRPRGIRIAVQAQRQRRRQITRWLLPVRQRAATVRSSSSNSVRLPGYRRPPDDYSRQRRLLC